MMTNYWTRYQGLTIMFMITWFWALLLRLIFFWIQYRLNKVIMPIFFSIIFSIVFAIINSRNKEEKMRKNFNCHNYFDSQSNEQGYYGSWIFFLDNSPATSSTQKVLKKSANKKKKKRREKKELTILLSSIFNKKTFVGLSKDELSVFLFSSSSKLITLIFIFLVCQFF